MEKWYLDKNRALPYLGLGDQTFYSWFNFANLKHSDVSHVSYKERFNSDDEKNIQRCSFFIPQIINTKLHIRKRAVVWNTLGEDVLQKPEI